MLAAKNSKKRVRASGAGGGDDVWNRRAYCRYIRQGESHRSCPRSRRKRSFRRARLLVALGLPLRFDIPLFLRGNAGSIPAGRAN
jgi:hypothetical protein